LQGPDVVGGVVPGQVAEGQRLSEVRDAAPVGRAAWKETRSSTKMAKKARIAEQKTERKLERSESHHVYVKDRSDEIQSQAAQNPSIPLSTILHVSRFKKAREDIFDTSEDDEEHAPEEIADIPLVSGTSVMKPSLGFESEVEVPETAGEISIIKRNDQSMPTHRVDNEPVLELHEFRRTDTGARPKSRKLKKIDPFIKTCSKMKGLLQSQAKTYKSLASAICTADLSMNTIAFLKEYFISTGGTMNVKPLRPQMRFENKAQVVRSESQMWNEAYKRFLLSQRLMLDANGIYRVLPEDGWERWESEEFHFQNIRNKHHWCHLMRMAKSASTTNIKNDEADNVAYRIFKGIDKQEVTQDTPKQIILALAGYVAAKQPKDIHGNRSILSRKLYRENHGLQDRKKLPRGRRHESHRNIATRALRDDRTADHAASALSRRLGRNPRNSRERSANGEQTGWDDFIPQWERIMLPNNHVALIVQPSWDCYDEEEMRVQTYIDDFMSEASMRDALVWHSDMLVVDLFTYLRFTLPPRESNIGSSHGEITEGDDPPKRGGGGRGRGRGGRAASPTHGIPPAAMAAAAAAVGTPATPPTPIVKKVDPHLKHPSHPTIPENLADGSIVNMPKFFTFCSVGSSTTPNCEALPSNLIGNQGPKYRATTWEDWCISIFHKCCTKRKNGPKPKPKFEDGWDEIPRDDPGQETRGPLSPRDWVDDAILAAKPPIDEDDYDDDTDRDPALHQVPPIPDDVPFAGDTNGPGPTLMDQSVSPDKWTISKIISHDDEGHEREFSPKKALLGTAAIIILPWVSGTIVLAIGKVASVAAYHTLGPAVATPISVTTQATAVVMETPIIGPLVTGAVQVSAVALMALGTRHVATDVTKNPEKWGLPKYHARDVEIDRGWRAVNGGEKMYIEDLIRRDPPKMNAYLKGDIFLHQVRISVAPTNKCAIIPVVGPANMYPPPNSHEDKLAFVEDRRPHPERVIKATTVGLDGKCDICVFGNHRQLHQGRVCDQYLPVSSTQVSFCATLVHAHMCSMDGSDGTAPFRTMVNKMSRDKTVIKNNSMEISDGNYVVAGALVNAMIAGTGDIALNRQPGSIANCTAMGMSQVTPSYRS